MSHHAERDLRMYQELVVATLASTGIRMQGMLEAGTLGVIVRCAICGYSAVVMMPWKWERWNGKHPEVWFCDHHRREWNARHEEI